ncbi:T9SS type A sorting domain-containing protein [Flavobacterium sp.]|uniref:T9SS type A sorting domain-containing protein n=1 Tax=Flavobacterium sp. TaxID=239 RepID=UPI00121BD489|nr:T9SS type A sorting domain-containing protein [Flavobacterium sp.]RZJ69984.1 MAG: T9SS type A sorting domain-containing protein [Flavobacterium sp.]
MKQKLLLAALVAQTFFTVNAQQFGSRTVLNATSHLHNSFAFDDIDGDGDIDVIVTSTTGSTSSAANHVAWYKNLGNNTFSAKTLISSAYNDVNTVRLLDVDEDGKKDLVVADWATGMSWIKNMGSGFFGSKQALPYNSAVSTFEVGDLNNDGKQDIVLAQLSGDSVHFMRNTGNGTFVYDSMIYAPNYNVYSIEFGDLDQDQKTDLIISSGSTTTQKVVKFEYGTNALVQTVLYTAPNWPYIYKSFLYDVDSDGKMDVVMDSSDCATYWVKNFGNDVYSTLTTITTQTCMNYETVNVADLNLDGFMDTLYMRYGNFYYKQGAAGGELGTTMIPISINQIPVELYRHALYDIDGDGDLDLFYGSSQEFGWIKNNSAELSVNAPTVSKFSVYPNPANQELNIASENGIETYAIFDATGKLIAKSNLPTAETNHKIDVAHLSNGLYFVELQSGNSKETKKFVKN